MSDLVENLLEAQISNADPSNPDTWLYRWHWLIEQHDKSMDAEIERLNNLLRGVGANRYWEGRWRDERAANERLRAALRPFAEWAAREFVGAMPEDGPIVFGGPLKSDLTRARSALEQSASQKQEG